MKLESMGRVLRMQLILLMCGERRREVQEGYLSLMVYLVGSVAVVRGCRCSVVILG